ncbi:MAG: S-layer homology domain-containing protein [Clostridia bacterium]|nr:S-layer homology domain-containing protein [Clostridia bacterium]
MKRIISAAAMVFLLCLGLGAVSVCAEEETMTRLEAIVYIEECMSANVDENYAEFNPFTDAPEGEEACLGYAYSKSLVKGVGDNLFVPEREVTREEFLLMALRLVGGSNAAWGSNAYVSAFVSAYVAGIYDYTDDIDVPFTTSEAETIMARVFALERYSTSLSYFPAAEPSEEMAQKVEEEKAQLSEYRKTLSSLYTSYDAVYYFNELNEKAILFKLLLGTPHGSAAIGYVINKSDATYTRDLPLPDTYTISLMPDEIWVSEDEKTLYYSAVYEDKLLVIEGREKETATQTRFSGTYTCEVNLDTMEAVELYIDAE